MTSNAPILPPDAEQAVNMLLDITRELRIMMEEEAGYIARRDDVALLAAEKKKNELIERYQQAAEEFKNRAAEFRAVDRDLLERLANEQGALGLMTRDNQHFLRA